MNGRVAVAALACVLALAACKKAAEPRMKSSDIAQASRESSDRDDDSGGPAQDACGLLEPSEVEVVLGPLAGAPFRVQANNNKPDMRGDGCRYEGRDLRSISLDMNRTGGAALMKMMGLPAKIARDVNIKGQLPKGALPEDVRIAGEWDEIRIMGCCRLSAVLGDALVVLEFSGSRATMEQAVTLLNKALLRLDKTLPISGRPGVAAAEQRMAARPRPRPVCELITQSEAEAILGPLSEVPKGSESGCTYRPKDGNAASVEVDWSWGFSKFRDDVAMSQNLGGKAVGDVVAALGDGAKGFEAIMKKMADKEKDVSSAPPEKIDTELRGPWDQAAVAFPYFAAVKKDVLLKVDTRGVKTEMARLLAAKAMEKL